MMRHEKAIVIFSGGQDSTTCLGWAKNRFQEVETITFDYGQRHKIELDQAKTIADKLDVSHTVFTISELAQLGNSALIGNSGEINSAHQHNTALPASYVPNRNALFFTIAHAYAQKVDSKHLITGVCQTDYSGYPDCREDFVTTLASALNLGSDETVRFHYPLMYLSKSETFQLAQKEGVLDTVIEYSHTCYEGDRTLRHAWGYGCGTCPACRLREKGYQEFLSL
jgi:7-cyano-7-deazaguanine synthase